MISVSLADALIKQHSVLSPSCSLSIENAASEVLREDLFSDRCQPPFNRVAMDGIAIVWERWHQGQTTFKIEGIQKAGDPQRKLKNPSACFEVMTGAILPEGCDTVIRYEDLEADTTQAKLIPNLSLSPKQNIHHKGSDCPQGELLLKSGQWMLPAQWAVAASVGKAHLKVSQRPKIAVISTGDELVPVAETPLPHQIRMSNAYVIQIALEEQGFKEVERFHLADNKTLLLEKLAEILARFQIVILSGGVSMGKYDFIPEVLAELKVKEVFHKIKQRPGKPLWFGVGSEQQLVFGLPGNPVSTTLCVYRYVLPALWNTLGRKSRPPSCFGILQNDIHFRKDLSYFPAVRVAYNEQGQVLSTPVAMNGSGDYASLALSDGFLELPSDRSHFMKGEVFPLWLWTA